MSGYAATGVFKVGGSRRLDSRYQLYSSMPPLPVPTWAAPFDTRHSFILDELAVWFCNSCFAGSRFVWNGANILMVAAVCWEKRLAIYGDEFARIMTAHGMPPHFANRFASAFDFAVSAMIMARGRRPVAKWRDRLAMNREFSDIVRQWGRGG